jgi:hypothetical protein
MPTCWSAFFTTSRRAYAPATVVLLIAFAVLTNSVASTYSGFMHTHAILTVSGHEHDSDSHGNIHEIDLETPGSPCGCLPAVSEDGSLCGGTSEASHEHVPQLVLALLDADAAAQLNPRSQWIQAPFVSLKPCEKASLKRPPRAA